MQCLPLRVYRLTRRAVVEAQALIRTSHTSTPPGGTRVKRRLLQRRSYVSARYCTKVWVAIMVVREKTLNMAAIPTLVPHLALRHCMGFLRPKAE